MKIQWKKLIASVLIPLGVGGLSALLTGKGMEAFETLRQPPLSPPAWLFPVVWTLLYIMMGTAFYLVWASGSLGGSDLAAYSGQLFLNFFWSIWFFGFKLYLFAFVWLALLWLVIAATAVLFARKVKTAGWLLLPYLLWAAFAGYLNYGVYLLN